MPYEIKQKDDFFRYSNMTFQEKQEEDNYYKKRAKLIEDPDGPLLFRMETPSSLKTGKAFFCGK